MSYQSESLYLIATDLRSTHFIHLKQFKKIQLMLVFNEHEQSVVVHNENAFFVYKLENGGNQSLSSPDKTKSIVVLPDTK